MATNPEHDALLERALSGDSRSLVRLLEAIGPIVRARIEPKISHHLRSSLDADDVMQVTYIEAVTRISTFQSGGASGFLAWLSRMAENNMIDAIRALEAARRPDPSKRLGAQSPSYAESMASLVDILGATSTTPSIFAARGEAATAIERALASLPPDYEKVIRMYDLQARPIEEVASALGKSHGATFMLRARAHDRLREAMGGDPAKFFSQAP